MTHAISDSSSSEAFPPLPTLDPSIWPPADESGYSRVGSDPHALPPREWTMAQTQWAEEVLRELRPGPVLELCSGAGQSEPLATSASERRLVSVDIGPAAVGLTALDAPDASLDAETGVRRGLASSVLGDEDAFALIIADPEDTTPAAEDGLDLARECIEVGEQHLLHGGAVLLQLDSLEQAAQIADELSARDLLRISELRNFSDEGVMVRLDHAHVAGGRHR
jgi:release factor glutamine methyltransferase